MSKVSIIIPIYRVEKYLEECVQSVLNQTYKDLEIILVDDGSPDGCPAKCDEYAKTDSRIKVIHRQNGGLSAARNTGLDIATGDYIYFLDSDDKIFPHTIETMMEKVQTYPGVDVIAACGVKEDGSLLCDYANDKYPSYTDDLVWIHENFCNWEIAMAAWNKLYKTDFIKKNALRFPEGLINEDIYWYFYIMKNIKSIAFVVEECYWYRLKNEYSITNEIDKTKTCLSHLHIVNMLEKDILDELEKKFIHNFISYKFFSVYFPLSKYKLRIRKTCKDIHNEIKKRNPSSLLLQDVNIITLPKWMISTTCFYAYRGYQKLLRILKLKF